MASGEQLALEAIACWALTWGQQGQRWHGVVPDAAAQAARGNAEADAKTLPGAEGEVYPEKVSSDLLTPSRCLADRALALGDPRHHAPL